MAINFQTALGIHEPALKFRAQRAEIIANNLANVDTPHFKARDLDFKEVFADYLQKDNRTLNMAGADGEHFRQGNLMNMDGNLLYRVPSQPSIDGNSVDEHVENAAFMANSLDFQSSFTILNNKFRGLMTAIRGE
jgi:flagellar basal-body rod protein FlgB